jgi:hypothetical protein
MVRMVVPSGLVVDESDKGTVGDGRFGNDCRTGPRQPAYTNTMRLYTSNYTYRFIFFELKFIYLNNKYFYLIYIYFFGINDVVLLMLITYHYIM